MESIVADVATATIRYRPSRVTPTAVQAVAVVPQYPVDSFSSSQGLVLPDPPIRMPSEMKSGPPPVVL